MFTTLSETFLVAESTTALQSGVKTVSCLKTVLRQFLDVLVLVSVLGHGVLVLVLELLSRSNDQDCESDNPVV